MGHNQFKVFLSYVREDEVFARKLAADLLAAGFTVFDAGDLPRGPEWATESESLIRAATHVVVIVSSNSDPSKETRYHVNYARSVQRPLIPVLIEGRWSAFKLLRIDGYARIDARDSRYQRALVTIVKKIRNTRIPAAPPSNSEGRAMYYRSEGSLVRRASKVLRFRLYSVAQLRRESRSALLAYAYSDAGREDVQADAAKFAADFGGGLPIERTVNTAFLIKPYSEITFVPQCEGLQFEPPSLTKTWVHDDWLRFYFDFRVPASFQGSRAEIRVSVRINRLEVAHIDAPVEIVPTEQSDLLTPNSPTEENPLAIAKQRATLLHTVAVPYRKIFISYAHKDRKIALKRVNEIERVLGSNVFIDVKSLRAGDDWEAQLATAIDDADVFHLLWSLNSAKSEYCRYEWDYALNHKCAPSRCVNIIQPVYWRQPMPPPPPELNHLHFEYVNFGLRGFSLTEWFTDLIGHIRAIFSPRAKGNS